MAIASDVQVGYTPEGSFKTYTAPTRFVEIVDENLKWAKAPKQGQGLRVGSRIPRAGRRVVPTAAGKGDITVEVASKGQGTLFQACTGTSTSTLVSGTTYQQVHAMGPLGSLTVQKGVPQVGGSVDAYSFLGGVVDTWDLDSPNGEIVTLKVGFDFADLTTAQSLVAATYPTAPNLFHFGQATAAIGGTVTDATTTALATSASPITTGVRSLNLSAKNNPDTGRYNYGAAGRKAQQVERIRAITGKFQAEYDQTTLRDAFINDTNVSVLLTFTGAALSVGNETLQISLPCTKFETDIPDGQKNGDLVLVEHSFTLLDNLSNAPLQVVFRTSDTAL